MQIAKVSFILNISNAVRSFESKEKWKSTTEKKKSSGNYFVSGCQKKKKKKGDSYGGESPFNQVSLLICFKATNLCAQKLKRHKIKSTPLGKKKE